MVSATLSFINIRCPCRCFEPDVELPDAQYDGTGKPSEGRVASGMCKSISNEIEISRTNYCV